MIRKKEFSLVDDSKDEHNRRMKAVRQRTTILEEDFAERNQRNRELCHMPRSMSGQGLHADVRVEEGFRFSSTEVSKTEEDIDEAFCIAACNLSHLHDADKMLKCLELKVKQEGDKAVEIADRAFDELGASLLSRKNKLLAELVKSINNYSASVAKVKEVIEERKKCLMDAAKIARECKITPSIRTYVDLPQVIYTLKLPVEAELSQVKSLSEKLFPRFFLNTDENTSLFQNVGKIEWGTEHEGNTRHTHILDGKEEMPGCNTWALVETVFPVLSRESNIKALESKRRVHEEVINTPVRETLPVIRPQSIPAQLESPSSPDVIIEEIFEDDVEEFPTEYHTEEQRRTLFRKETSFQHKAAELVFVSHVVNPCHFYVRRYSQKKEARVLEKKLENFCNSKSSHLLPSDFLELGARTFIKSKETGMWCRGTITELIPLNENKRKPYGPLRYRVCDIALLEVFLIDLGSTVVLICSGYVPAERPEAAALELVETDDLCLFVRKPDWHIEAELAAVPPLAVQCSLKDIVPKNASEGWGEEAKIKFLGMVKDKVVSMTIFSEEDGVLIVDLRKPPFNKISNNMPVSLRDALVFLDLARFKSQLPGQLENDTILQYSPPKIPQEREVVSVVVCHINSPGDFYLQLSDSLYSPALSKRIQNVYNHESGENLELICPVEGQACIAKQEDGNWYRARIIGLPSNKVMVKYVDFGNVAHVTLKDIRRIKKEFLSSPEKAIRCRLACIEPYKGANEWNRDATRRFEEMTECKHMQCLVDEILDNNILSVELFDSSALRGRGFSINCQLVEENLASFIPGCIASAAVRPNEIWDVPPDIPETSEDLSLTAMESVGEGDFRSLSKKELQVRISHVVSPSKIFIQWLSSEHTLKSLQKEMATTYRESQPQSVKWECSMHCAVYVHDLKQWHRGQISRIISKTRAEVILYDSGVEKTVDISCLRKLEENMKIIGTLAIECSLADISPTGGSTQWTATVCEYLSSYLTGAQVKMIIQGSDETCALPVNMLYKDETGKLVDVSEHLVQKGLALRRRRINKTDVACSVSKKHLKVHVEQEDARVDGRNSEAACARNSTALQESIIVSESEQNSCKRYKSVLYSSRTGVYKSPAIPEERVFQAVVSCIGNDGTIYVIPKSFETELKNLMTEIQSDFKCLRVLEPHCWKKGEPCVVRGSDILWYRGAVVGLGSSVLQVQFIDHGFIETVIPCNVYPTTLYTSIPPFCIPCQLYKTVPETFSLLEAVQLTIRVRRPGMVFICHHQHSSQPRKGTRALSPRHGGACERGLGMELVGNFLQQDAVGCLQELLINEEVEVHVQELPSNPWDKLSIKLYFGGISLSSFMAYQKYCVAEDCDVAELELFGRDVPGLPSYVLPPLPVPGDTVPVSVTHLVSPKEVYICLDQKSLVKQSAAEGGASCGLESESLDEALKWWSKSAEYLPPLTQLETDMPCLVEYEDGLWYRGKVVSTEEFNLDKIVVQFVDYGSFSVVPASRLRSIPYYLLKYPIQAVRALLAGFKPPLYDRNAERVPCAPEWSKEALCALVECVEGKQLSASVLALSPALTISLYEDDKDLVHMKLIEKGLADLDE